jgi:hypothetical protein
VLPTSSLATLPVLLWCLLWECFLRHTTHTHTHWTYCACCMHVLCNCKIPLVNTHAHNSITHPSLSTHLQTASCVSGPCHGVVSELLLAVIPPAPASLPFLWAVASEAHQLK